MILTFLHTVGPGGDPDENGETTLDALIMNGVTAAYSCCIAAFIVA
jgi:isoaspartyl peptidase/L-asparaginase-like protein (Ntn-hydrolase superfamily)